MPKMRQFLRKVVVTINDMDSMSFMDSVLYGIKYASENSSLTKAKVASAKGREIDEKSKLANDYIIYIRRQCINYFANNRGGEMIIKLDRNILPVLSQVLNSIDLRGYTMTVEYINSKALKLVRTSRIPLKIVEVID